MGTGLLLVLGALGWFAVSARSGMARVHGRVTRGGQPVPGARVVALLSPAGGSGRMFGMPGIWPLEWSTTSGEDGTYELLVRTDGQVMFMALDPVTGREGAGIGIAPAKGGEETLDLPLGSPGPAPAPLPGAR